MKAFINLLLMVFSVATAASLNNTVNVLSEENNFTCATDDCAQINRQFKQETLKFMNITVDPCDNFHGFVCGNARSRDRFTKFKGRPLSFDKNIDRDTWQCSDAVDAIRNYQNSCAILNLDNRLITPEVEKKRVDYLKKVISRFGGWPVLKGSDWNDTEFDWTEISRKFEKSGVYMFPFLDMEVIYLKNWTIIQQIQTPDFEISEDDLSEHNITYLKQIYRKYMGDVAEFMGATSQQAEELNESLEFEMKLINASKSDNSSRKYSSDDLMSVEEMKAKWPTIDWSKFFSSRPQSYFYTTNKTKIFVKNPEYITNLEKLVRETPKRVLANYAVWKVIDDVIEYVGSATLMNIWESYAKSYSPEDELEPVDCGDTFMDIMPILVLPCYLSKLPIDKNDIALINQFVADMKKKMIEIVDKSNKFDSKAKNDVVQTINSLATVVGQTDTLLDEVKFKKYIQGLHLSNDNFLQNYLSLHAFISSKMVEDTVKPRDSIDLTDTILRFDFKQANAEYDKHVHTIGVGPRYLEKTWVRNYLPNYVNYATMGSTLAHALGHSVDSIKRDVNILGVAENKWSAATIAEYGKTDTCLIEQFNKFTFKSSNRTLNGSKYLVENIADLISVKVAYSVYQDFVKKRGAEPTYSGLPYNPNQMFWISYANQYCALTRSNAMLHDGKHSPFEKRVIATVSNSPDFARDFNCPVGSKMNPQKKCDLF